VIPLDARATSRAAKSSKAGIFLSWFVTFRTAVVSSLLDPRTNLLPFLELLIVVDQTERDREEANEATVLLHSGDA
jgi:hypothetical protein